MIQEFTNPSQIIKGLRENIKLRVFIQANCQSYAIKNIFEKVKRLTEKYEIIDVKPIHLWKDTDFEEIIQKVKKCDIFLHQPISELHFGKFSSGYLKKYLKGSAFSISFPNLHFITGYHPQAFYLTDDNGKKINGPFNYHDKNILDAYIEGKTIDETKLMFIDENYYSIQNIKKTIEQSFRNLEKREIYTDIKISPIIANRMKNKKLFHIFNHPSNELLSIFMNKVLERLQEKPLTYKEMEKYSDEILDQIQFPIYKSVQKYYKIEDELKMVFFRKEYNLEEFINIYFTFYSTLDIVKLKLFFERYNNTHTSFTQAINENEMSKFENITETNLETNISKNIESEISLEIKLPKHNYEHYMFKHTKFERPLTKIYSFDNAYLSIDFTKPYCTEYYLFDNNQNIISSFSNGDNPFLLERLKYIDESVGFIEDKFTKFNICHFILDKLTRMEELSDHDISSFILFSENNYTNYISQLLKISFFEFNKYKSAFKNFKVTFQLKKIIISTSSAKMFRHPGQNINFNAKKMISKIKSTIPLSKTKYKIYIDRSASQSRRVINHKEIIDYLLSEGFIIVKLEELTVDKQLKLFKNAVCVVGVHGAGLTNIAFCSRGTKIIEILPSLCATAAFWKLAKVMNLEYDTVLSSDPDFTVLNYITWKHEPAKYNRRDVYIPLNNLIERLNN
ncbi:MAG: WcbI family polysaccharide biosynthesis putative acetyltransferase [Sulfurovum sp.]|nr:WcbI family polysaccharide biosynthesis putative acetyltransferase [Sulfurovum sp.]